MAEPSAQAVLTAAHALLNALNWQERGLADLSSRAREAFSDLAVASEWKATVRPRRDRSQLTASYGSVTEIAQSAPSSTPLEE